MPDDNNIYFGFPNPTGDAADALHAALGVVDCLKTFIDNANDMQFFDREVRGGALYGLSIILGSLRYCLERINAEMETAVAEGRWPS